MMALRINIEGIDGSGKSSIMAALQDDLPEESFAFAREPTSHYADIIHEAMYRKNEMEIAMLFLADRARHQEIVRKHLFNGKFVICDRGIHSTLAYQMETLKPYVKDPYMWMMSMVEEWLDFPDVCILLAPDIDVAIERIEQRNEKKVPYENREFLERVACNYGYLYMHDIGVNMKFYLVDANNPFDQVYADVKRIIMDRYRKRYGLD